jgi:hypothetical protein
LPSLRAEGAATPALVHSARVSIDAAAIGLARILKAANAALGLAPITITDYRAKLSEGGPNDYYSNGD